MKSKTHCCDGHDCCGLCEPGKRDREKEIATNVIETGVPSREKLGHVTSGINKVQLGEDEYGDLHPEHLSGDIDRVF